MTKYTNIDKGPRGLNTTQGKVWVDPSHTVEVELAKGEEAPPSNWFTVAEDEEKASREPAKK
jgi:hypothetical protein